MATYEITSPDGEVFEVTAPDGASEADVMAYAQSQFKRSAQPEQQPEQAPKSKAGVMDVYSGLLKGTGQMATGGLLDAAGGMVSGIAASAYGGIKGLTDLVSSGGDVQSAANMVRNTVSDNAYQPQSAAGRTALSLASLPIEYASEGAGKVGGMLGEGVGGEQGRIAGESIGETSIPVAATLFGGAGALRGAKGITTKDVVRKITPSSIPIASDFVRGARDVYRTRSASGREKLAQEYLQKQVTPDDAPKIISALERRAKPIVPNSPVTSADAIARGNREAALKGKPDRFGSQYVALEESLSKIPETTSTLNTVKLMQEKARADVLNKGSGTDISYKAAENLRAKNADRNYGKLKQFLVESDAEVGSLMLRPSMDKAIARAESLAKEKGDAFKLGKDVPEQVIPSSVLDASGKPASSITIPAQTAKYPVESLQYIKMALDDMLRNPKDFGISGSELSSIAGTRAKFIKWLEQKSPIYEQANAAYAIDSVPLNQMDLWRAMRNKFIAPTGKESPGTYLRSLRDEAKLIKQATGFTRADDITSIFNKEQSALANRLAAEMEMELLKKRMAGEVNLPGVGRAAEGLEPQLPNMLMRETMIANFLLRTLAKDANVDVNVAAARILKDPKQLAGVLKQVKPKHRPQVLANIKQEASAGRGAAALSFATSDEDQP